MDFTIIIIGWNAVLLLRSVKYYPNVGGHDSLQLPLFSF